ncbi:cytochrome P450 [Rhodococcus sp. X156]|uniref:cytochrome P450 n=1 Tax=Rhodococcus sp. X156 TaxID=2499145 RepID=UPI000FD927EB|nr:cytochrome P450 [Rhodococcus sp. X156]
MRSTVRWALQHGLPRALMRRAAAGGDLQARLLADPTTAAAEDPFLLHDEVRAQGPVIRGRLTYLTATHSVVRDVLRSDDFRAGNISAVFPWPLNRLNDWAQDARILHPIEPPSLLAVEPPEHTRYRRQVSRVFTARAVEALRPQVQALADGLLDDLLAAGPTSEIDLVADYATLLPVAVIAEILGVPAAERAEVLGYGAGAAPSLDMGLPWREFRHVDASLRAFDAWLGRHLQRLRRDPGDDLLSQLVTLTDDGERLSETELRATAGLLLAAGFETTVNLLSSGVELLLRHPDQVAVLRTDPSLWGNAVEEVLRMESPVQLTARSAVRDTEVAGMAVPAGQRVVTLLGGANRDPAVFTDPHTFDVARSNAREHLSFSGGRHFCLGASLARMEGEIGLRALFERFPDLQLGAPGARRHTRVLRGWQQLPVVLGAPSRGEATALPGPPSD